MSVAFKIQKATPFPNKISGHAAFIWRDIIFIWGGGDEDYRHHDRSVVYMYHSGEWIRKQTTDPPPNIKGWACEVINDTLFVVEFYDVYALDLNNWTWSRLCDNKIYFFS